MTTIITRIFESRDVAAAAVEELKREYVLPRSIDVVGPPSGDQTFNARAALASAGVADSAVPALADAVSHGATAVVVRAGFGQAVVTSDVLARHGGRDLGVADTYATSAGGRTASEVLGLPLLSDNPAPLSTLLGFPVLARTEGPPTRLIRNPAPFSDTIGLPLLSEGPEKKKNSFGFPMLSDDPAPLSATLGLPLLADGPEKKDRSFGAKMLSDDPAPFSRLLGLPVLLKDD